MTTDYLDLVFDEFVELHGDKFFGDDRALRTGFAKLDRYKVLVVGHQKGKTLKERNVCFFGCAHPEGYRKAMAKMQLAAKFHLPIICLIDTPGAYPGIGAEERGQAQVIAQSMFEMSRLRNADHLRRDRRRRLRRGAGHRRRRPRRHARVRLLLGHQPRRLRRHPLEEPRLRRRRRPRPEADRRKHLHALGVIDDVIDEPLGGAHRDHHQMATRLKMYLIKTLRELVDQPTDKLLAARYEKFRRMGQFLEPDAPATNGSA